MSRALIVLRTKADRDKASRWAQGVSVGSRVEFKAPRRSLPQNDLMWELLTILSNSLEWRGQKWPPEDWKDYMMHSLKRMRWMPDEDGGMVPVGMRTSDLSKDEMSDLIECIYAFGARNGVTFSDKGER